MEKLIEPIEKSKSEESNNQREFVPTKTVVTKSLKNWGFVEAGLNQGDPFAFKNRLSWIKAGHIVDKNFDEVDEVQRKMQLEAEVASKGSEIGNKENEKQHIKDVVIVDKENQLKQQRDNIEQKRIAMVDGMLQSHYNPARFSLYASLVIIISVYLVFFYASAMNAAFFRNIQQMVNNSNGDDVSLMLNSIFDAKGIFQASAHLLFVYLGAFLFFGFGMLPHIFHDGSKNQWIKMTLAILLCLAIDCLIAYKIDSGIHQLKLMMGVADNDWGWYKSVNFYLVLAFGFGTYMLWGFIYEAAISEYEKKNVNAKAEIEIKGIKLQIREIENQIIKHKEDILELQKIINGLELIIEKLKKDIERALTNPETLTRNIENFYAGWLQYLNGTNESEAKRITCEEIYVNFQHSFNNESLN